MGSFFPRLAVLLVDKAYLINIIKHYYYKTLDYPRTEYVHDEDERKTFSNNETEKKWNKRAGQRQGRRKQQTKVQVVKSKN